MGEVSDNTIDKRFPCDYVLRDGEPTFLEKDGRVMIYLNDETSLDDMMYILQNIDNLKVVVQKSLVENKRLCGKGCEGWVDDLDHDKCEKASDKTYKFVFDRYLTCIRKRGKGNTILFVLVNGFYQDIGEAYIKDMNNLKEYLRFNIIEKVKTI